MKNFINIEDLLNKALGLTLPWKVLSVELITNKSTGTKELHIRTGFEAGSKFLDKANKLCDVQATTQKTFRHLDFFKYPCYITGNIPQIQSADGSTESINPPVKNLQSGLNALSAGGGTFASASAYASSAASSAAASISSAAAAVAASATAAVVSTTIAVTTVAALVAKYISQPKSTDSSKASTNAKNANAAKAAEAAKATAEKAAAEKAAAEKAAAEKAAEEKAAADKAAADKAAADKAAADKAEAEQAATEETPPPRGATSAFNLALLKIQQDIKDQSTTSSENNTNLSAFGSGSGSGSVFGTESEAQESSKSNQNNAFVFTSNNIPSVNTLPRVPFLVAANGNSLEVYLWNTTNSQFDLKQSLTSKFSMGAAFTADLNNDGSFEVLCIDNPGPINGCSIFISDPNGSLLQQPQYLTNGGAFAQPTSLAVGDFNGNGLNDIAIAFQGSQDVKVWYNQGNGVFNDIASHTIKYLSSPDSVISVVTADVNGYGLSDIIYAQFDGKILLATANPSGGFNAPTLLVNSGNISNLNLGDFNNNGNIDLVYGTLLSQPITFLAGNGDGTFQPGVSSLTGQTPFHNILHGKFNNDGFLDLAYMDLVTKQLKVVLGNGDGTFTTVTTRNINGNLDIEANNVAVGDFNQDGSLDVAIGKKNTLTGIYSFDVFLGDGTGVNFSETNYILPTGTIDKPWVAAGMIAYE